MGNALDPILFIMRNQYGQFDWRNLDPAIESAVAIASRLGRDADEKVLRTTLLRGRRLAHTSRGDHATTLALFTDILPCDRGVAREVFEADAVGFRNKQRMAQPAVHVPYGSNAVLSASVMPQAIATGGSTAAAAFQPGAYSPYNTALGMTGLGSLAAALPTAAPPVYTPPTASRPPRRQGGGRAARPQGGAGRGRAAAPAMSAGQRAQMMTIRRAQHAEAQQQQLQLPGVPRADGQVCNNCKRHQRNPHHDFTTCAFLVCNNCKLVGHRKSACTNPFAPE